MKKFAFIALTLAVVACAKKDDVPTITDPDNITVDGKAMTAEAFYNQYCKLTPSHETCIAVDRADKKFKEKQAIEKHLSTTRSHTTTNWYQK